ncbi:MAG: hypothetical protein JO228_16565, partial [Xanthobacteraceae bacterium]|nr:hypothetical protein [Xanthobacteraceae bacterium]
LVALFTGVNPFHSEATEAITVDIITPDEAPPVTDPWAVPDTEPIRPPKPQLDVAALTPTPLPMPVQPPPPEPKPAEKTEREQRESRRSELPASSPVKGQELGKAPPSSSQAPPPQVKGAATDGATGGAQGAEKQTNVGNLFSMPLALPDGRLGGAFDAPATETAKIERSSVEAFRERVKSCARLPAGVSPSDRVSLVVRIDLQRDGTLAGEPTLIEASASPKGPAVLQSLFAGLAKCQPFNMLPAEKYQEWRTLDIRFTPQDLGQFGQ